MTGGPLLDVRGISTAYGLSRVLFEVSVQVAAGECVALLGRNGVGKTTTMRSIMGLTPPQTGQITWHGQDITGWPPYQVARAGLGFVPEDRRIFAELTVLENLDVAAKNRAKRQTADRSHEPPISGHPRPEPASPSPLQQSAPWTVARVFELFPKLAELGDRQGGFLSGGEQQMLTIARTLMGNPELLLLDEPSEGLAPLVVDHLGEQIARLKAAGLTILLSEQNVAFSLALADRVYVLEKGSIRFSGPAAALRANDTLRHELLAL
ncbi:MAG TPA: ABC transporter ATP-binding protein [Methylomirabilota bacterium]|jgi:branched-chain amino acid transport system ATP-binding protein